MHMQSTGRLAGAGWSEDGSSWDDFSPLRKMIGIMACLMNERATNNSATELKNIWDESERGMEESKEGVGRKSEEGKKELSLNLP